MQKLPPPKSWCQSNPNCCDLSFNHVSQCARQYQLLSHCWHGQYCFLLFHVPGWIHCSHCGENTPFTLVDIQFYVDIRHVSASVATKEDLLLDASFVTYIFTTTKNCVGNEMIGLAATRIPSGVLSPRQPLVHQTPTTRASCSTYIPIVHLLLRQQP